MKEHLRQEILTKYPEWHLNPFRLSIAEMEAPLTVLDHFFQCYTLPQIRACLKEMVHVSLMADDTDAPSHVTTHEDIEKLVEAAWVIDKKGDHPAKPPRQDIADGIKDGLLDCYQAIQRFFDAFSLPFARSYLLSSIKASESSSIWKKKAPADLIYFYDCLKELISAVFDLLEKEGKIDNVIIKSKQDSFTNSSFYCASFEQDRAWDYFPRSLTRKEYLNPYKALEKFSSCGTKKEWKETIHYLLTYALGANSLSELGVNLELVRISELLQKMLEACHLTCVRTRTQNEPHVAI